MASRLWQWSLVLSQAPANTVRPQTWVIHCVACLFNSLLLPVLTVPTYGGMARLSRSGRLVLHRDGLPARRQLPILAVTGLNAAQLR